MKTETPICNTKKFIIGNNHAVVNFTDAQDIERKLTKVRDALEFILAGLKQSPQLNEEIVKQVMRDDHTLEIEIGGIEADISVWTAAAKKALSSSPDVKPDGPRPESKQTGCQTNEAAPMSGYAVPSRAAGGEEKKL